MKYLKLFSLILIFSLIGCTTTKKEDDIYSMIGNTYYECTVTKVQKVNKEIQFFCNREGEQVEIYLYLPEYTKNTKEEILDCLRCDDEEY